MTVKIDDCPRCGSDQVILHNKGYGAYNPAWYQCSDCKRLGPSYYMDRVEPDMISEGWNRLTPSEQLDMAKFLLKENLNVFDAAGMELAQVELIRDFLNKHPEAKDNDVTT